MSFARVRALVVVGVLAVAAVVFVIVALVRDTQGGAGRRRGCPAGSPLADSRCPTTGRGQDQCLQRAPTRRPRRQRSPSDFKNRKFKVKKTGQRARRPYERIAVLRFGPKAVGAAHLLRAYFLNEAEPEYDPKRTDDVVDVVIGDSSSSSPPPPRSTSRWSSSAQPGAAAGACAAPSRRRTAAQHRRRRRARLTGRPAASSPTSAVVQRRRRAPAAPPDHVRARRRRPARPATSRPASVATRPPAAWSQALRPFSKYASTRALGGQAQVERGRAEPADVPHPGEQPGQHRAPGAPAAPAS